MTRPRYIGGEVWPRWADADFDNDIPAPADERHPEWRHDTEWSTDQSFHGEFGYETAFGEPIE